MGEKYSGVKYQPIYLVREAPDHPLIPELSRWCKKFHESGLAPPYEGGSYGNLSFRVDGNTFIITASKSGLAESVENDRFVYVHYMEGLYLYQVGVRDASSEAGLHLEIYRFRKDVNAVFHGHCREVSENACRLGIPITDKFVPYGTSELIEQVMATLGDNNYLEMRDHGFISLGRDLDEAGKRARDYKEKCCIK
jgi:ribulose-5-phosphate 4-epimerase/fuculose-1-phosphate aldolase